MKTFRRLLGFLRPYRRSVALSGILATAAMAMTVAIPALTGKAIDQIHQGDKAGLELIAGAVLLAGIVRLGLNFAYSKDVHDYVTRVAYLYRRNRWETLLREGVESR